MKRILYNIIHLQDWWFYVAFGNVYTPWKFYHVKDSFYEGLKCVWIYDLYSCMFSVASDEC